MTSWRYMVRHCGKLLAGLAVPMTVGAGSITQARAQGFLELEQTPTFIGRDAGSVPDYKGWGDRSPSRREVLCA